MARTRQNPSQQQSTALGLASITADFSTASTTFVQVTGLSVTVTVPAGRSLKITVWALDIFQNSTGGAMRASLWDGTVNTGTQLAMSAGSGSANTGIVMYMMAVVSPAAGSSKTYNVGFKAGAGTATFEAGATYPAFILVEPV